MGIVLTGCKMIYLGIIWGLHRFENDYTDSYFGCSILECFKCGLRNVNCGMI